MLSLFKPAREAASACAPAAAREVPRPTVAPRVDIFENDTAVTIVADMPGVAADGVDVRVHGDTLTLRGTSRVQEPAATAVWREYGLRDYERGFRLGHAIDTDAITAGAKDGVIRVVLPKRSAAQPRRIAVSAG